MSTFLIRSTTSPSSSYPIVLKCNIILSINEVNLTLRQHEKESTEVRITQKEEKKRETLIEKIKRSPDKRHTQKTEA